MTRIVLLVLALSSLLARAGSYSQAMFHVALTNSSTAPDYVLITVRGPQDGSERAVCTTANLFLGAIHREYGLGYSPAEEKRALDIALKQADRSFRFRKQAAVDNLADHATPEALAEVRSLFAAKSDSDLLDRKFIQTITNKKPDAKHRAYRDAVARALLERGIGCVMGCVSDELFPHL